MDSIKKLTELFAKFPTIGSRTAGRFVFYLLKLPKEKTDEIINAILELKSKIRFCNFCFNPYEPFNLSQDESQNLLCSICQNSQRNRQLLCVIEKEADLQSIENTKKYQGLYFILNGASRFRKSDLDALRINELKERFQNPQKFLLQNANFIEVIIATNPTPEGKATSVLVQRALKELGQVAAFKITHLGQGLPVGGEVEYADEETLESAFDGRK